MNITYSVTMGLKFVLKKKKIDSNDEVELQTKLSKKKNISQKDLL